MTISKTLQRYLEDKGVDYDLVPHKHTYSSSSTAEAAHVPGDCLAKAVIPSTHRLDLERVHERLQRPLELVTESELEDLFPDCELGAIPPVGTAFGVETLVEERLMQQPELWFEAGDHEDAVHVSGTQFQGLMQGIDQGRISNHR